MKNANWIKAISWGRDRETERQGSHNYWRFGRHGTSRVRTLCRERDEGCDWGKNESTGRTNCDTHPSRYGTRVDAVIPWDDLEDSTVISSRKKTSAAPSNGTSTWCGLFSIIFRFRRVGVCHGCNISCRWRSQCKVLTLGGQIAVGIRNQTSSDCKDDIGCLFIIEFGFYNARVAMSIRKNRTTHFRNESI